MSAAKKQRAAIYARVSDDDGKTESIPTQVRQCRDYAKSKGMTVVTIFDKDSGISGGIPPHLRPDGARLYAARKRGEFDAVIVTEPTRFYRSDELASVLRDWEAAGIAVVFVGKEIDMEGDDWELTAGVHGIMGQQFRRMIARKTHAALVSRVLRRSWVAGKPYGYDNGVDKNQPDRKILIINKEQAKTVRLIFDRWNDLESCSTIAQELNKAGIPSPGAEWKRTEPRQHSEWINTAVRAILQNPVYTGLVQWNASKWKLDPKDGKRKRKENKEDKVYSYREEAYRIVPNTVFAAAQKRFSAVADGDPRLKLGGKTIYRLSGLLQCDACSRNYVLDNATHYSCSGAKDKACTNKLRIRRDLAEKLVMGKIDAILGDPAMVQEMAREVQKEYNRRTKGSVKSSERTELEAKISRLRQRVKTGDRDIGTDELQAALDRSVEKLAALDSDPARDKDVSNLVKQLPKIAELCRRKLASGLTDKPEAAAEVRKLLRQLVGGGIKLAPIKASGTRPEHLEARFLFQRIALLDPVVGPGCSGGRI